MLLVVLLYDLCYGLTIFGLMVGMSTDHPLKASNGTLTTKSHGVMKWLQMASEVQVQITSKCLSPLFFISFSFSFLFQHLAFVDWSR